MTTTAGVGPGRGWPEPTDRWRDVLNLGTIRAAAAGLEPLGVCTPLQRNERLSEQYRADVYLKREDLQAVRSYKIRGAYTFIAGMPGGPPPAGVVCASAGNHAQGVAWSCRHLGVRATVFLPRRTPRQKVDRIRAIGAAQVEIRFAGHTFDDAAVEAAEYAAETGAGFVSAFDHPATLAGQGTVMLEVARQLDDAPDVVLVPIGGGGLVAGVAACVEGLGVPTAVIGAQPAGAPAMVRSLAAGRPTTIDIEDDFVDGAVVRTPGRIPVAVTAELVHDIYCVPEGRVCTALLDLYQDDGIVAEPAGALSIAALDDVAERVAGRVVVCVLSGGNNDVARYDEIIERSLVYRGLKHYFIVEFPQQPGSLRRFLDECLGPDDDITLFEAMQKSRREYGTALVGIELAERSDLGPLLDRMAASGLEIEPVTPGTPAYRYLV
jgi:threonine dehydratase